ncbi:hypothetical protein [Streptomyces sp. NPDC058145]
MSSYIDQSLYTELTLTPDQQVKVPTPDWLSLPPQELPPHRALGGQ